MFIFEIVGDPIAQKQTRFAHGHAYDPSKKDKEMIQWQVKPYAPSRPLSGPIELSLTFFMPIPKSTSGIRRQQMLNRLILPIVKPDEDNLAYLVTNSLKKIVYEDDNQICAKHVYKFYGDKPKTVIKVRVLNTMQMGDSHENDIRARC